MPLLRRGSTATLELVPGESIALTTGGTIVQLQNGESVSGYDFTRWPVNIGPFVNSESFIISATESDITYTVSRADAVQMRLITVAAGDLPAVGEVGAIYETELGWYRWSQIDGLMKFVGDEEAIPLAPANDTAPVIAGDAEVDAVLTVTSNGVWDNRPDAVYTYQWQIDGVDVEDATASTFTVPEAAEGLDVTCDVTASNVVGSATEASNAISIPE
jgi:hypothetical protein